MGYTYQPARWLAAMITRRGCAVTFTRPANAVKCGLDEHRTSTPRMRFRVTPGFVFGSVPDVRLEIRILKVCRTFAGPGRWSETPDGENRVRPNQTIKKKRPLTVSWARWCTVRSSRSPHHPATPTDGKLALAGAAEAIEPRAPADPLAVRGRWSDHGRKRMRRPGPQRKCRGWPSDPN